MSQSSWERLLCGYFYEECINVLNSYFSTHGFVPKKNKIDGVVFQNDDIFVEVSYNPETYPAYSLTIVVGIGTGAYDDGGKFTGVPIWSLVDKSDLDNELSKWSFSNEGELKRLLKKTKIVILDKYIKPLWIDREKLKEEIDKFIES